jgi:hypothetical protein
MARPKAMIPKGLSRKLFHQRELRRPLGPFARSAGLAVFNRPGEKPMARAAPGGEKIWISIHAAIMRQAAEIIGKLG